MTYCVGLRVQEGLVLLADTQTNAGLDNVSRFTKLFTFEKPGERVMTLLTAGNLSITQGVIARLRYGIQRGAQDPSHPTIMSVESLFEVAQLVGAEMRRMQDENRESIVNQGTSADASILLAGQRKGGKHRLFLIYSAGNFIQATDDTPYFQLGEHKYGKPILDRIITPKSSIEECMKAVCISMDSTIGLVRGTEVVDLPDGGHALHVTMTMTAPGCGMGDLIRDEVLDKLRALPGVKDVKVEIVLDPPWEPSRMSEAARLATGIFW